MSMRNLSSRWIAIAKRATTEMRLPPLNAEEETAFCNYKAHKVIHVRRFAAILAPIFWLGFLYWDVLYHLDYRNLPWIIGIRILGTVFLTTLTLSTFRKSFYQELFAQRAMISAVVVAWIGTLAMSLLSPAPGNYLDYYGGLMLILFFLFTIVWISAWRATIVCLFLLIAYGGSLWIIWSTLPEGYVRPDRSYFEDFSYYSQVAIVYLSSFLLLGSVVAHQLEGYLRRNFLQQRALKVEQQKTAQLNNELQERISHIEEMNVQEQRQAQSLLDLKEDQRRLAVEENRKKSMFLASATHDLRQPITALQAIIEALNESLAQGDLQTAREHMALTRRSSRAMRNTLNAVLEISRLESGLVKPDYSNLDIKKLVQDMFNHYSTSAVSKGTDFRLRLPSTGRSILVRSDNVLLTRIISNLISNAIKYTPIRPNHNNGVLVGIVRLKDRARVDVFDTGIGIAKEYRAAIFEPFFQIGNRERDRDKGLGLGLSIVRQIVDLLDQHRLEFRSIPGKGSRFSLEIPICMIGDCSTESENSLEIYSPQNIRGTYILLVEDDGLVCDTVKVMLESWGCLVETCADLEMVNQFVGRAERIPDVVLTDFRLPDNKSAYDVIAAVQTEFRRDVPVVVITGEMATLGDIKKGVSAVLPKPPDNEILRQAISACLPKKET